jgi:MFS family permease
LEILSNLKNSLSANTLRTLKYRNYRLFFGGQIVSLVGTAMQQVAVGWLVYRLTNSAFLLGIASFAALFPTFLLSPVAGAIADKFNRQKILIVTQILFMIQAVVLFILVTNDVVHIWHIIALNAFSGIVSGFDAPVRQAFVVEMVEDKKDLGNAIALNSMMFNSARLLGPSIAGLIVAGFGEAVCFFLNAISFLGVIAALYAMRITKKEEADTQRNNLFHSIKEGFSYTWNFVPVRTLLILISIVSLFGTPYIVLMPAFAKTVLHGGAHTMGFLIGGVGFGALIGALVLASRKSVIGLPKKIAKSSIMFSAALIAFSISTFYPLSQILVVITGYYTMSQTASSNTIIQTIIDDKMRGRVMSFYTMSFLGFMPFGSLLVGTLAESLGTQTALLIGGVVCMAGALWLIANLPKINKVINVVYEKNGIIKNTLLG